MFVRELRPVSNGFSAIMSAPNQSERKTRLRGTSSKVEQGEKAMFFAANEDDATRALTIGPQMAIAEVGVYRGPHYYSHTPMIRIQLDLGRMEAFPTNLIPGFTDALLATLPGVGRHGCSLRVRGGFEKRLREGTWIGHVAEHAALELQTLAGSRVARGKTRSVKGRPGVYNVMFAYNEEKVGLLAGRIALELVDSLLPPGLRGIGGGRKSSPASPAVRR